MAENSKIEWTHHTFNPHRGCTKVSDGCKFCYAETLSKRNGKVLGVWGPGGTREPASESYWREPLKWNAAAQAAGERHRVFCASLADVFEDHSTITSDDAYAVVEASRARLWPLIEATPHLDWLLLTKRPQNILAMVPAAWQTAFPKNVWPGTSVEDQAAADSRVPHLLEVPADIRFLSCEPLLGAVDLTPWTSPRSFGDIVDLDKLNRAEADASKEIFGSTPEGLILPEKVGWIIAGGESGPHARIMQAEWARSLRNQAVAGNVPFLFKQWGEWRIMDDDCPLVRGAAFADRGENSYLRVGKQDAGRLLDGREWNEFPTVAGGAKL